MPHQFKGKIQSIQWNNRIKSNLLMIWFLISMAIFVILYISPILLTFFILDPDEFMQSINSPTFEFRIFKIFFKIFSFTTFITLAFIYRDFKNTDIIFSADKINLKHNNLLHQKIENLCIERGLKIPDLYVIRSFLPNNLVTSIVLQDFSGNSKIILSQGALSLPAHLQEALAAQAIQRIYTKDALFFTLLCFFGYFPFHVMQNTNKFARTILKPFLFLTDKMMSPIRNSILNIRSARMDAASLALIKEKQTIHELLEKLASLKEIENYYHEAYLPLFVTRTDIVYRQSTLEKA